MSNQKLTVVQFVHPGFEYPLPGASGVMGWKDGNTGHDRKFILTRGSIVDWESKRVREVAPLGFWGEWEGPSVYWRVRSSGRPLPAIVHAPFRPVRWPSHSVQNTDPMVFGDAFIYSNCLQNTFTTLRALAPGSMILFGRHGRPGGEPVFSLDTCLVVDQVTVLRSVHGDEPCGADLLRDAVLRPLHSEGVHGALGVHFGKTRSASRSPFSFFPARSMNASPPLFARPSLTPAGALDGVVSPRNMQGIKITAGLNVAERDEVWSEVARQVAEQGCALGFHASPPPAIDFATAEAAAQRAPAAFAA
jgi:hypothetical protein